MGNGHYLDILLKLRRSVCCSVALVLFLQAFDLLLETLQLHFPAPLLHLILQLSVSPGAGSLESLAEDGVIQVLDLLLKPLNLLQLANFLSKLGRSDETLHHNRPVS